MVLAPFNAKSRKSHALGLLAAAAIPLTQLGALPPEELGSEQRFVTNRINDQRIPAQKPAPGPSKLENLVESAQRQLSPIFDSMRTGSKLGKPQGLKTHDEFVPYVSQSIELKTPLL